MCTDYRMWLVFRRVILCVRYILGTIVRIMHGMDLECSGLWINYTRPRPRPRADSRTSSSPRLCSSNFKWLHDMCSYYRMWLVYW